ncbi:uncharacterized protein GGS25DRAFT_298360 [Hypoxylon fragiforme]|uniref:uncharacterized protein n=1 Tax=Hypoxylon fragiforme TaxID=63214 RepID=UPI0020C66B2C|nr:uncharacterized protein GGS25DRAFT_298360 [Hypoxylon fragiforme]KAI2608971.1 hypothetical protein GGS25DRAFT_298360 [Hypoxylon fragiforme]
MNNSSTLEDPRQALIRLDLFLKISEEELLKIIREEFADELERLKRAYYIPSGPSVISSTPTPSRLLFNSDYGEVNRTLVGLLTLKWICTKQYDTLVGTQAAAVKLSKESFDWIYHLFNTFISNYGNLYALITSILINDLGKDEKLVSEYWEKTDEDISDQNHDMILLKAVEAGMVPAFDRLTPQEKDDVRYGIRLGAEFNFGQLAQAENPPASLSIIGELGRNQRAFKLHFMEQLLDVAGAAGHMDWTCAKKLNQPIFEAFRDAYTSTISIVSSPTLWTLRQKYDMTLLKRSERLNAKGFRELDVVIPADRALLRLLCMGSVSSREMAELYDDVWGGLQPSVRSALIEGLNIDGAVGKPAVQPTYMPAIVLQVIDADGPSTQEMRKKAFHSALVYLSRVLGEAKVQDDRAIVIECNLLRVLKDVVQSDAFLAEPSILETTGVPKAVVAKAG